MAADARADRGDSRHRPGAGDLAAMRKQIEGAVSKPDLDRIENTIDAEIHAAVAAAKHADFADIDQIIASNWSGEYSPVVSQFTMGSRPGFKGGQLEARLGPF